MLGIPFVIGRPFADRLDGRELVVSESAARLLWPNENPIGNRLVTGSDDAQPESHEIVGVVADVSTTTPGEVEPVVYQPVGAARVVLVRDLAPAIPARVKDLVQFAVPGASSSSRPLVDEVRDSLTGMVIGSRIAWVLSLLALMLAGCTSATTARCSPRLRGSAISATPCSSSNTTRRRSGPPTTWWTSGPARGSTAARCSARSASLPPWWKSGGARSASGWPSARGGLRSFNWSCAARSASVLAGLAAGLTLSLMIAPVLRRALYGMSPFDPIAYLQVAAILLASSLVAAWIPAARATRVEPAITLRAD